MADWIAVMDGAEMRVLAGNPDGPGEFSIQFRTDRRIEVPLHWHPEDEHINVLCGPFRLTIEGTEPRELDTGSSVTVSRGVRHATAYGPGTLVQVTGLGPFESLYVE